MKGLLNARVAVIDDDPREAALLLASLGSMGIAAAYFDGTKVALPSKPLSGIRVVFLDLNLNGLTEPRHYLPHTVGVLNAAVAFGRPNAVVLVAWTKHEETLAELRSLLATAGIVPAAIVAIEHKFGLVDEGSIAGIIAAVQKHLREAHESLPGVRLLLEWEHEVTFSAAEVAGLFHAWSHDNGDSDVSTALSALGNAMRDTIAPTRQDAAIAVMDGLNSVLADRLLAAAGQLFVPEANGQCLISDVGTAVKPELSRNARARLNQILMTSQVSDGPPRLGDVYVRDGDDVHWPIAMSPAQRADFFKATTGREWLTAVGMPKDKDVPIHRAAAQSWPALVEISPACDHQQGKLRNHRLIGGMLIPCSDVDDPDAKVKIAVGSQMVARVLQCIWMTAPAINYDGPVKLILDARWPMTLSRAELEGWRPVCRLRASVVADLQAWVAAHAARPGYVSIT